MNAREFLDLVLQQPSNAELVTHVERLVAERVPEDTWLDYKGGEWTTKVDTADLRRDVTAFGNSDGGCLVIGVAEADRRATAFKSCQGDLDRAEKQVNAVITTLASQLWPPPREVRRVTLSSGEEVFVLAVPRSARMVALPDNGANAYYHRVADGTARIPEYLLSDLLFGRRQRPVLTLENRRDFKTHSVAVKHAAKLNVYLTIGNHELSWVEGLHGGAIFYSTRFHNHLLTESHPLQRRVTWGQSPFPHRCAVPLALPPRLAPLAECSVEVDVEVRGERNGVVPIEWTAAVYVGSSAGPPQWWEVSMIVPFAQGEIGRETGKPHEPLVTITESAHGQPNVRCVSAPAR